MAVAVSRKTSRRLAAATAVLIGAASVLAGSQVLLGLSTPGYTVLRWLVVYNVLAGAVAILAGMGLWTAARWSPGLSIGIAGAHLIVLLFLVQVFARDAAVAAESLTAMLFRSIVWLGIAWVARVTE